MIDDLLNLPAAEVFKDDPKSRVWRVEDQAGRAWVIKRWAHARWRQRLQWWLGAHPAQQERRRHAALNAAGLPAMPIERCAWSGGGYLVTPYKGLSLYNWLRQGGPRDPAARQQAYENLGALIGRLFAAGVYHRDFKASNLIIDRHGAALWLIDAGTARLRRGGALRTSQKQRMLRLVWDNLLDASTYDDDPRSVEPTDDDRRVMRDAIENMS